MLADTSEQADAVAEMAEAEAQWLGPQEPPEAPPPLGTVLPIALKLGPGEGPWSDLCRYCLMSKGTPQGRAAHERSCPSRPNSPPLGPGTWDISILGSYSEGFRWEVRRQGSEEVVADSLGRTWKARDRAEDDVAQFMNGPATPVAPRGTGDRARKLAARTAPPRPTVPAVRAKRPAALISDAVLLDTLEELTDGKGFPPSALPDVLEWVEQTRELLERAR